MIPSRHVTKGQVRIASAILTLIGIAYTWMAFRLPAGDPPGSGPGGTPIVIGSLWVITGAYVTLRPSEVHTRDEEVGTWPDGRSLRQLLVVFVLCVGFLFAMPLLGISVTSAIFMTFMARLSGASWSKSIIASIIVAATLWLLFVQFLQLSLPTGSIIGRLTGT